MRLSSLGSSFVFNIPSDFLPQEVINKYNPILEKNWIQYENVLDYLNSTIKTVDLPGLSIDTPEQTIVRGKKINYKPAKNVNDIVTAREFTATMRSVDSDLNYWIMYDIFMKHYLDVYHTHQKPFSIMALDIHRDAIYQINFYQIIFKSMSDMKFDYSQQKIASKEFNLSFTFNFFDIDFLLDKSKVIDVSGSVPVIINRF